MSFSQLYSIFISRIRFIRLLSDNHAPNRRWQWWRCWIGLVVVVMVVAMALESLCSGRITLTQTHIGTEASFVVNWKRLRRLHLNKISGHQSSRLKMSGFVCQHQNQITVRLFGKSVVGGRRCPVHEWIDAGVAKVTGIYRYFICTS